MYRNARRWTSRSLLVDSLVSRWLTAGGEPRPRKPGERREDSAQLAASVQTTDGNKNGTLVDNPHNNAALNEHDAEHRVGVIGEPDPRADIARAPQHMPDAFATNRETGCEAVTLPRLCCPPTRLVLQVSSGTRTELHSALNRPFIAPTLE